MFAEERRAEIAKLVASARRVNGAELARRYDVTMETVRRDLAALEEAGKLRRVHGGAVTVEQSTSLESSIASRQGMNTPEKRRIATKAYNMLRDSEVGSIVLDAGSTIEILADQIGAENFSLKTGSDRIIITHALHIAVKLAEAEGITMELVGGQLRKMTWAAIGARAANYFSTVRPDIAFIGANGIGAEFGNSLRRARRVRCLNPRHERGDCEDRHLQVGPPRGAAVRFGKVRQRVAGAVRRF